METQVKHAPILGKGNPRFFQQPLSKEQRVIIEKVFYCRFDLFLAAELLGKSLQEVEEVYNLWKVQEVKGGQTWNG